MSVICGQLCQHPACWKASIDLIRHCHLQKFLESGCYDDFKSIVQETNVSARSKQHENFTKFTARPPQKKEETTLPKLHVLTLDPTSESLGLFGKCASESPTTSGEPEADVLDNVERRPEDSSWSRDLTEKKIPFQTTLKRNDLNSNLVTSHNGQYEKVLVWVPNKRGKKTVQTVPPGTLGLKLINGDCLPCFFWHKNPVKLSARARSTGSKAHAYRRAQRFSSIDQDLLDGHGLMELFGYSKSATLNRRSEVCLSSPLKTAPICVHPHVIDEDDAKVALNSVKVLANEAAPNEIIMPDATAEPSAQEQVGHVSAASRDRKDFREYSTGNPKRKPRKRSYLRERVPARPVLPLTKVSVPKRQMRRCPGFGPCATAKRLVDLSEVFMKPLSRSENNSVASLDSLTKATEQVESQLHQENMGVHPCETPVPRPRYFPSQIHIPAPRPSSSFRHEFFIPFSISAPLWAAENVASSCGGAATVESDEHDEHRSVAVNCTVALKRCADPFSSCVDGLCGTTGKAQPRILHPPLLHESSESITTGNRSCGLLSTATSLVSKVISEADQNIIAKAYDKYSSFLPFKTPDSSLHVLEPISQGAVARQHVEESSLPSPSLQTEPLPRFTTDLGRQDSQENIAIRSTRSFPTPGLSPSRSMHSRQLKQPSSAKLPEELTVSRINFNKQPSRCLLRRRPRSVDAPVVAVEIDNSFDRAPPSSPETFVAGAPLPIQCAVSAVLCNGDADPIDIATATNEIGIPPVASSPEVTLSVRTSLNEEDVDGAKTDFFHDIPISKAANLTGSSASYDSLNLSKDDNEYYVGISKSTSEYDCDGTRVESDQIVSGAEGSYSVVDEACSSDMHLKTGSSRNSIECVNASCPDISFDLSSPPIQEYEIDAGSNFRSDKAGLRDLPGEILNPASQTGLQQANSGAAEHALMLTSELHGFQGSLLRTPTPHAELYQRPSSPYFDSRNIQDFTTGLNLDLNLEEEISKAMEGLEYLELSGDCLNIDAILS